MIDALCAFPDYCVSPTVSAVKRGKISGHLSRMNSFTSARSGRDSTDQSVASYIVGIVSVR